MYSDVTLVKSLGGVGGNDVLALLISSADEYINSETLDDFSELQNGVAKVFDGSGSSIVLTNPKLSALSKLEYLSDYKNDVWSECDLSSGIFTFGKGWVIVDSGWTQSYRTWFVGKTGRTVFPKGLQNIRVTGDWGWNSVPAQIRLASATLAAQLSVKVSSELSSERLGDYSYTKRAKDLLKSVESLSIQGIIDEFRLHKLVGSII